MNRPIPSGLAQSGLAPSGERQSTPVIPALDGLRGLAAIAVVTFHYKTMLGQWYFPSAYLAVDLFFIISGIVISLNYEDRLHQGMGTMRFLRRRLVRLAPIYWLALALGTGVSVLGIVTGSGNWTWASLAPVVLAGAVLLPNPLPAPRADLFPLNPPAWSLFWELAVNLAYALALPWLGTRTLLVAIAASGLSLMILASHAGGLDFGYDRSWLAIPALRVVAGFSIGVLIARQSGTRRLPTVPLPVLLALALVLLAVPISCGWKKDIAIALLAFPALCACAMRSGQVWTGLCRALGLMSYPLYALHAVIPFEKVAGMALHRSATDLAPALGLSALAVAIALSWALGNWIDGPVRAILRKR